MEDTQNKTTRQLYTALSRCEYLHQIYLIRGEGEFPF